MNLTQNENDSFGLSSSYLIVHEVQTTNYKVASELIMSVNCAKDKVKGDEKSKCPSLKNKTVAH